MEYAKASALIQEFKNDNQIIDIDSPSLDFFFLIVTEEDDPSLFQQYRTIAQENNPKGTLLLKEYLQNLISYAPESDELSSLDLLDINNNIKCGIYPLDNFGVCFSVVTACPFEMELLAQITGAILQEAINLDDIWDYVPTETVQQSIEQDNQKSKDPELNSNWYIVPHLSDLYHFSSLQGSLYKQNNQYLLNTTQDLSDFFRLSQVTNGNLIISDISKFLYKEDSYEKD